MKAQKKSRQKEKAIPVGHESSKKKSAERKGHPGKGF